MKKTLFLLAAMLCLANAAMAVPAFKARKQVACADGTTLDLTLTGDEHLNYWTDQYGRALRLLEGDKVHVLTPFELEGMRATAAEARARANVRRKARTRALGQVNPLFGKKKGLVILMQTSDVMFSREDAGALYRDVFSKEGYSEDGFTGSVSDYFRAQSYGQFEIDFDVAGPYTARNKMVYYGRNDANGNDAHVGELIEEALVAADADVNFKDYDWDGDGEVEQVYVLYAGYGANFGNHDDAIWPHESALQGESPLVMDGVRLSTYACSCEFYGNSGTTLDGIGTACHEFSHCLGFPDFYDTVYGGNAGMSVWDLLDQGSYNNRSRTPAGYTSYERFAAGWLTPKEITGETVVTGMKPLTESPEAYILYNEKNRNEYYLLENRQPSGFDAALPGHGLLVVHVDYDEMTWKGNSVNVGAVQHMTFVPADGDQARSPEADPFPGTKGVTWLTDVSTPAATLNNRNSDGTKLMHKPIEAITEEDGLISMVVCAPPLAVPEFDTPAWTTDGTAVCLSWQPVERAKTYELVFSGNPRKGSVEEAVVMDEDFAGCYKSTVGFADIASSMNNFTTNKGFSGSKLYQSPNKLRIGTSTTKGHLRTPVFEALNTGDLTIVMDVVPLKEGTSVSGNVHVLTGTGAAQHALPFTFSDATRLVLHSAMKFNDIYQLLIEPESGMYLTNLTLYDGNFSEEELGMGPDKAPGRGAQDVTVTTDDTSYVFTNLDPTYEYTVKIRAREDGRFSLWSDACVLTGGADAIESIPAARPASRPTGIYDLQGRRVTTPVRKGIYIINGRKVVR